MSSSSSFEDDILSDGSFSLEEPKHEPRLATKETWAVYAGKYLVLTVLLLAAALMGFLTYWFTKDDEEDAYEAEVSGALWLGNGRL